jgi:hypothetical protein
MGGAGVSHFVGNIGSLTARARDPGAARSKAQTHFPAVNSIGGIVWVGIITHSNIEPNQ